MYDLGIAQNALERTSPEFRAMVEATARRQGMSSCEAAMEIMLAAMQQVSGEALYAMKKDRARPHLRSV